MGIDPDLARDIIANAEYEHGEVVLFTEAADGFDPTDDEED